MNAALIGWLELYLVNGPRPLPLVQRYLQREHTLSLVEANKTLLQALRDRRVETYNQGSGPRSLLIVRQRGDHRTWPPGSFPRTHRALPLAAAHTGALQ